MSAPDAAAAATATPETQIAARHDDPKQLNLRFRFAIDRDCKIPCFQASSALERLGWGAPSSAGVTTSRSSVAIWRGVRCAKLGHLNCAYQGVGLMTGHATPALVMNTYGHVTERMQQEASAVLDRVLGA